MSKDVMLSKKQVETVMEWYGGILDAIEAGKKGPSNEYEQELFAAYDGLVSCYVSLDEAAEANATFKANQFPQAEENILASRDAIGKLVLSFLEG